METKTLNKPQLMTAEWANLTDDGALTVSGEALPIKMMNSDGTGKPLFSYNGFGADVIRFAAGEGADTHTHDGDHILFVLKGTGIVEYDGVEHPLYPGLSYLIQGCVQHALRAHEDLVLITVGNHHLPLDAHERSKLSVQIEK